MRSFLLFLSLLSGSMAAPQPRGGGRPPGQFSAGGGRGIGGRAFLGGPRCGWENWFVLFTKNSKAIRMVVFTTVF